MLRFTALFATATTLALAGNMMLTSPAKAAAWDPRCPHGVKEASPGQPNTLCSYHSFNPYNATETVEQAKAAFKGKKGETFDPTTTKLNIFGTVPWVRQGGVKVSRGTGPFKGTTPGNWTGGARAMGGATAGAMSGAAGAFKK